MGFFGSTPATLLTRSKFSCKHCITCGPFEAMTPSSRRTTTSKSGEAAPIFASIGSFCGLA